MKKLLKIAIALGMVLCLSVTAFASGSNGGANQIGAVDPATGAAVEITEEPASVEPTVTEAAAVIAAAVPDAVTEDLTIAYVRDLTSEVLPVTISFEIPGATAEDTVYVLHYDGTAWEVVATCPGNAITATFETLSPVALALELAPAAPAPDTGTAAPDTGTTAPDTGTTAPDTGTAAPDTGTTAPSTGTTSPKTGEGLTVLYAGAVMVLAGAVAFTARKKKENA